MNDHREEKEHEGSSQPDENDHLQKVGSINWTKLFRVFLFRVPLWLVALVLVVIGGWAGYSKLTAEEPVTLKPAVTDALKVEITITTCNDNIDKAGYEIRDEEKRIEGKLQNKENVEDASVLIQRDEETCRNRATQSKK